MRKEKEQKETPTNSNQSKKKKSFFQTTKLPVSFLFSKLHEALA